MAKGSAAPVSPTVVASDSTEAPASAEAAAPGAGSGTAQGSSENDTAPAATGQDASQETVVPKSPVTPAPSARTDQTAVHQSPAGSARVDQTLISPPPASGAPNPNPPAASAGKASVPAPPTAAAPNAGKASVPVRPSAPHDGDVPAPPNFVAPTDHADPDMPTVFRPGWTIEPGWSAYPNGVPPKSPEEQTPSFDDPDQTPNPEHTSSLAGALLGPASAQQNVPPEPESNNRRTMLVVAIVLVVAVAVGAGIAIVAGDTIMSVLDGVLS